MSQRGGTYELPSSLHSLKLTETIKFNRRVTISSILSRGNIIVVTFTYNYYESTTAGIWKTLMRAFKAILIDNRIRYRRVINDYPIFWYFSISISTLNSLISPIIFLLSSQGNIYNKGTYRIRHFSPLLIFVQHCPIVILSTLLT